MTPTISVLIPTAGRDTLSRCLDSINPQLSLENGDECLVIGDTHDGPLPAVEQLVEAYGAGFRYLEHDAGHRCFGHCQLNYGMTFAQGDYLTFNDDDDIYSRHALTNIRTAVRRRAKPAPMLFRFVTYFDIVVWDRRRAQPLENFIGGHCAVFPNIPERLGRWTCRYQGDYDFIRSTLDLWPNQDKDAAWIDEVIAIARPNSGQDWTRKREAVTA